MDQTTAAKNNKFNENVTLEELRRRMQRFADERDWNQYHTPRNLLLAMVGEVGELSEIFQWKGEVSSSDIASWGEKEREHLGEELSDVLLYLIRLSDKCGIDLASAAQDKIKKNEIKYPVDKCKGSSDKYTAYNSVDDKRVNLLQ